MEKITADNAAEVAKAIVLAKQKNGSIKSSKYNSWISFGFYKLQKTNSTDISIEEAKMLLFDLHSEAEIMKYLLEKPFGFSST